VLRIRAAQVHPVTAPVIEDGAVLIDDAGRIAAVGPHAHVPSPPKTQTLEFRDAELIPGLVNCHTHLELTHLAGKNSEPDFVRWIREVRTLKDRSTQDEFLASAEAGLRDCWTRGVTCVADTGSTGAVLPTLARLGGRGIAYHEVFGPDPSRAHEYFSEFERQVSVLAQRATRNAVLGVSPHAPYTVSDPLYGLTTRLARRERFPLAVHLAESPAETALVRDGAGPFADALRARGITVPRTGQTPVQHLGQLGVLASCLCIHVVQADGDDVLLLKQAGATVAHCPRSNSAHGHGRAPLGALREVGIPVGLGTDSVVSVGDLDLWAEAAAAGLAGDEALRMLTFEGARALKWEREIGSLETGKWGDLTVLSFPVLHHPQPSSTAVLTVVGGRVVYAK